MVVAWGLESERPVLGRSACGWRVDLQGGWQEALLPCTGPLHGLPECPDSMVPEFPWLSAAFGVQLLRFQERETAPGILGDRRQVAFSRRTSGEFIGLSGQEALTAQGLASGMGRRVSEAGCP